MGFLGDLGADIANVLQLRHPRRIVVELGDVDLIFPAIGTVLGKKQRLQALGHYYEPITGAAAGEAATEAYTKALAYYRKKRETVLGKVLTDPEAEADMQDQIRKCLVKGNKLPAVGEDVRVLTPGALSYRLDPQLGAGGIADGAALPSHRFIDEGALWAANPSLGKIPILIKVEMQVGKVWVPAPNEVAFVELIAPFYDHPAADELADINALRNTSSRGPAAGVPPVVPPPAPTQGPNAFLNAAYLNSFDAADPQRYNAHTTYGGKRGGAISNIFGELDSKVFPGRSKPEDGGARKHAVKMTTSATGECGFLFTPSRFAGDRYRFRIFLDPAYTRASTGTGPNAVAWESGIFTIWKHVLFSHYWIKPFAPMAANDTVLGAQQRLAILGYDVGALDGIQGNRTTTALKAFQKNQGLPAALRDGVVDVISGTLLELQVTGYLNGTSAPYTRGPGSTTPPLDFGLMTAQFQQMYVEFEVEPTLKTPAGVALDPALYKAAVIWAIAQAQAKQAAYGIGGVRDIANMFRTDASTPFLFEIVHPAHYNRAKGKAFAKVPVLNNYNQYWQDAIGVMESTDGLLDLVIQYLGGGATVAAPPTANHTSLSSPGINVLASICPSRAFHRPIETGQVSVNANGGQNSGMATQQRGCGIFGGTGTYSSWIYTPDGYTKNTLHEIGHVLYFRHQYTGNPTVTGGPPTYAHLGASFCEDHDSLSASANPPAGLTYDRCLMGYLPCEGEFCGKCHLKLRGWDISALPA